ncbi:hypothetical protein [Streptomyces sp. NPDC051572]|uniref:hypothetical protein n=1 Tax=unclassified Streptomyces TaxID=2593676 RepID=UPI00344C531B|nr:hypothetical protein OG496_20425 [Streptomyces sp. NBC_00988]
MAYLIIGLMAVFAGIRALGLRRRQLSAAAAPSSVILRPAVLAGLAGLAFAGGVFLLLGGIVVLAQG